MFDVVYSLLVHSYNFLMCTAVPYAETDNIL